VKPMDSYKAWQRCHKNLQLQELRQAFTQHRFSVSALLMIRILTRRFKDGRARHIVETDRAK
jgi:hypothetical protein